MTVYRGLNYAADKDFFDSGLSFARSVAALSYFLLWSIFYYTRLRPYTHYTSIYAPIIPALVELLQELYLRDLMQNYEPKEVTVTIYRFLIFFMILNWSPMIITVLGTVVQSVIFYFILRSQATHLEIYEDSSEVNRQLQNYILLAVGMCTLHYAKMKSISTLIIEMEHTKRQNQTTLQFFEEKNHAVLILKKA